MFSPEVQVDGQLGILGGRRPKGAVRVQQEKESVIASQLAFSRLPVLCQVTHHLVELVLRYFPARVASLEYLLRRAPP